MLVTTYLQVLKLEGTRTPSYDSVLPGLNVLSKHHFKVKI